MVVDLREIGWIIHHCIEAQRTCQGKFGRFEYDGPAHAVLLPAVDGGRSHADRAFGHIGDAEIQIHCKFHCIVAGINPPIHQVFQGKIRQSIPEDTLVSVLGDIGPDIVGKVLGTEKPLLLCELYLDIPHPFVVHKQIEEVEAILECNRCILADYEEIGPKII